MTTEASGPEERDQRILFTGRAHYRRGDYRLAIRFFKVAVEHDWDNYVAHTWLGLCYFELRRLDDAVVCFERAVEIEPGYARGWNLLGNAYRARGELYRALDAFEEACLIDEDKTDYVYNQASTCLEVFEYDRAARLYERILDQEEDPREVLLNLVFCHFQLEEPERAIARLVQYLDVDPEAREEGRFRAIHRLLSSMVAPGSTAVD